jgi:O-antigen/teichoic acid export membrane protein
MALPDGASMTTDEQDDLAPSARSASKSHLRGSSLLLGGRILAAVLAFVTQVLIVRYLAKDAFGAFAYGLAIVSLIETAATLGLDRSISRFVPIYDERKEYDKALGTVVGVVVAVGALSVVAVGTFVLLVATLSDSIGGEDIAAPVVLILVFLAPIQAIDNLLTGLFAVFARPGVIFFRRFVVTPSLRLAVVLLLIASHRGVEFLAVGYVLAGLLGMMLYGALFVKAMKSTEMAKNASRRTMQFPVREVMLFSLPLFTTDLVFVLISSIDAIMVGHFGDASDVAELRAVQPVVKLNQLVLASFGMLFTPMAARLFARGDRAGVSDVYWQTAAWVAVLSFPAFAMSFAVAGPLTVSLFGERYADAAPIMAVLALGYFANAALGFNGLTLNVFGLVRSVVMINLAAIAVNVVLNLSLIPRYGPLGAAIATAFTLIVQNLLRQFVLARRTGVPAFERSVAPTYLAIVGSALVLLIAQLAFSPGLVLGSIGCAIATLAVFAVARRELDLVATFPEVAKVPVVGRLLGGPPA